MKHTSLMLGLVILAVAGASAYALMGKNDVAMEKPLVKEESAAMEKTAAMESDQGMEKPAAMMQKSGSYQPFSPELLQSTAATRRVLFFYANWCPTCKAADGSFTKDLAQLPGDVTLIKVNYNDTETDQVEKDLAKQYGITYQHTFVQIDAAGKEITKWNGGQTAELLSNLK